MLYSMKEIQFLYYVILQSIRSNIKYYIYICIYNVYVYVSLEYIPIA